MYIGRVMGNATATVKHPSMEGWKLLLVMALQADERTAEGDPILVIDSVGAGVGEMVLYATGSSARQTVMTDRRPIDAVIMAIIDQWEIGGKLVYHKYREVDEAEA